MVCEIHANLRLQLYLLGLSLGTSDTVFVWLDSPRPQLTGHVWPSPVSEEAYMVSSEPANQRPPWCHVTSLRPMAGAALLQEREPDAGAGAGQLRGRGLGHLQPAHRLHAAGQLRQYRCGAELNRASNEPQTFAKISQSQRRPLLGPSPS